MKTSNYLPNGAAIVVLESGYNQYMFRPELAETEEYSDDHVLMKTHMTRMAKPPTSMSTK